MATAGTGAVAACLGLLIWLAAAPAASRPAGTEAAAVVPARAAPVQARTVVHRDTLAECEARLIRAPDGRPVMAVVGASYTAGVGPGDAALSWAVLLARALRWNAVVDGVSGVGYARTGTGGQGPVIRLLQGEDLRALAPGLVIVQAGHDDDGVPASLERRQVTQVIAAIRAAAPRARIALLTVFTGPSRPVPAGLYRTNDEIIAAGTAADPGVIIMNPLGGGWSFAHAHRGLHPTAAGDAWIAAKAAAILRAHGVLPAATGSDPVICDSAAGTHPRRGDFRDARHRTL